jgi:hypothetical protein
MESKLELAILSRKCAWYGLGIFLCSMITINDLGPKAPPFGNQMQAEALVTPIHSVCISFELDSSNSVCPENLLGLPYLLGTLKSSRGVTKGYKG